MSLSQKLVIPKGFMITTQETAWIDEERMLTWLWEIRFKYTDQKQEKLKFKFPWSFLTLIRNGVTGISME